MKHICLAVVSFGLLTILAISVLQNKVILEQKQNIREMSEKAGCMGTPPVLNQPRAMHKTVVHVRKQRRLPKLVDQAPWLSAARQTSVI